ncbi:MAG: SDR family NAD(P)-dependent oxidoreductase [Pseudomonadota bacterium]
MGVDLPDLEAPQTGSDVERCDIAIIGMGCRFPAADTPQQFWANQMEQRDCVSTVPADRWDWRSFHDDDPERAGKLYVNRGGYLTEVDQFDAEFFGIAPAEARYLDPQQRLLLEVVWETLENAQVQPAALRGTDTGVFVGISALDYATMTAQRTPLDKISPYCATGSALSTAAGRIAYFLGAHGPAMSIDTACSSSLVALHTAVRSLRDGESSQALVAGVNVLLAIEPSMNFARAHMLSADGKCKTFAESADGYVRGEGCGAVLLKPLRDAELSGDDVLAVIRGTAVNQDGASAGLTAPYGPAQTAVVRKALADARVKPDQVGYLEAHGTGTALGDPIELKALAAVFATKSRVAPLPIGSIKTQIGHLEPAAGMAGLIRVVLSLRAATLPPHLWADQLTSKIQWDASGLEVMGAPRPWESEGARIAGVSGFGFSGTNSHVVLQEYLGPEQTADIQPAGEERNQGCSELVCLSARDDSALVAMGRSYLDWLRASPDADLPQLAHSLRARRADFATRVWWCAADREAWLAGLERLASTRPDNLESAGLNYSRARAVNEPVLAFMFSGQGSQWAGMGYSLYQNNGVFREVFDRCGAVYREQRGGAELADLVFDSGNEDGLLPTAETQPALYAFETALAACFDSAGLTPAIVLGHSIGEFAAAQVAGVFSLEAGMELVCARGALMQKLPAGGGMFAVFATEKEVRDYLERWDIELDVAAINAPAQVVVSGSQFQLESLASRLSEEGISSRQLAVSHAFHSRLMQPMIEQFRSVCEAITYSAPRCELISNVSGQIVNEQVACADYWVNHVLAPVRFSESVSLLANAYCDLILEVGPQATLTANAQLCLSERLPAQDMPTILAGSRRGLDAVEAYRAALGACYGCGILPEWEAESLQWHDAKRSRFSGSLPNYPFQRQSFWFAERLPRERWEAAQREADSPLGTRCAGLLGRTVPLALELGDSALFQSVVSSNQPGFLSDHRVFGEVVFPAAAYLNMLVGAARAQAQPPLRGRLILRDVLVQRPVILSDQPVTLQTVCSAEHVAIHTLKEDGRTWQLVASANYHVSLDEHVDTEKSSPGLVQRAVKPFYSGMRAHGLEYGPAFRTVTSLAVSTEEADRRVFSRLVRQVPADGVQLGPIDPMLLDGAFQSAAAVLLDTDEANDQSDKVYLPVAIDELSLPLEVCAAGSTASAELNVIEQRPASSRVDLSMRYEGESARLDISGLRLFSASRESLLGARATSTPSSDITYHLEWPSQEHEDRVDPEAGSWLLVHHNWPEADALVRSMGEFGCTLQPLDLTDTGTSDRESLERAIPAALSAADFRGVLYVPAASDAEAIDSGQLRYGHSLLSAITASAAPSLERFVVLRPAQVNAEVVPQEHASLHALAVMARVVSKESGWTFAEISCDKAVASIARLANELAGDLPDQQVRLSHGERAALRLCSDTACYPTTDLRSLEGAQAYRLALRDFGSFDQLTVRAAQCDSPLPHQVTVRVHAAALNFKDLLLSLGSLTEYLESLGYEQAEDVPLGFEAAGVVAAIGDAVTDVSPGQRVVVTQTGCMASCVTVDRDCVALLPSGLSCSEGAALPTVFMTAIYALETLASIGPGDRVLIHAAAGGVGQAALQVARACGAEVFATASPSKWQRLRMQDVEHVYSSRDTQFADAILADTGGEGVDVVLNALSGDFIEAGLKALAQNGRFVEIGKVGVWSHERMQDHRPDVAYHLFDLADVTSGDAQVYRDLQKSLWARLESAEFQALPVEVFDVQEAERAMRHMSQARHIGKVVLRFPQLHKESPIRPDRSYLITGASGGIGRALIEWLAAEGARHLLLTSRKPSTELQGLMERLELEGVSVRWLGGDIAAANHVAESVAVAAAMAPLAGIFHAAGSTADGRFADLDWDDFCTVYQGKAAGAWHLHQSTEQLTQLEHFVVFSSVSSVFATPGQSNYAAANAAIDNLVDARWAQGLPALGINWGPWAGSGMAAGMEGMFERIGVRPLQPGVALAELRRAMITPPRNGRLLVSDTQWQTFNSVAGDTLFELLNEPTEERAGQEDVQRGELQRELFALATAQRRRALHQHLQTQLASTLGLPGDQLVGSTASFFDLGLDSLMGMELKGRLEQALDVRLQPTLLIEAGNLDELTDALLGVMAKEFAHKETEPSPPSLETAALMDLDDLSGEELEALLAASLDDIDEVLS